MALPGVAVLSSVYALALLVLCAVGLPVNDDAGFYLSVAEKISQGVPPYRELGLGYTPVSMLLFSLFFHLFEDRETLTLVIFAAQAASIAGAAAVLDRFFFALGLSRAWRALLASQFILATVWLEGGYIVLEPLTVVFMLLALWFGFRESPNWLLAGLFGGLAFLTKQYGLSCFLPLAYLWYRDPGARGKNLRDCGLGLALSIALVAFPLLLLGDSPLGPFALTSSHGKYVLSDKTPIEFAMNRPFILATTLALGVFAVARLGARLSPRNQILAWTSALAIVGSGASLFIRQFPHYYILPLPFFGILLAMLVDARESSLWGWMKKGLVGACFLFVSYHAMFYIPICRRGDRELQFQRAEAISTTLGARRNVLVFDARGLVFLAGMQPPTGFPGYSFAENFAPEFLLQKLPEQDAVLVKSGVELPLPLDTSGFERQFFDDTVELWVNKGRPQK